MFPLKKLQNLNKIYYVSFKKITKFKYFQIINIDSLI